MVLKGWAKKYQEILDDFNYDKSREVKSAIILNSIISSKFSTKLLEAKIRNKIVFVVGAGPSLSSALPYLKKYKNITKIVADGATRALIENAIKADIVITDLDGNLEYLRRAADSGSIMVVHGHGDNIRRLPYAILFRRCLGTTEEKPFGNIKNFGGFTDGDRCVFLARHFRAKKIILFGMDFGKKIGMYSKEGRYNKSIKLKKLRWGKSLLEWLASKDNSDLYTTSLSIRGFRKIRFECLERLVST